MMKTLAAALAFNAIGAALPASALSCMRPDPVLQYTQARDAEARYLIVHGTLTATQKIRKHKKDLSRRFEPKPIYIKARLQGMQLGRDGFSTPVDVPVTVALACFASWCGGWPGSDQMLLSVAEGKGGKLTVTSDPCGSQTFHNPTRADLRRVVRCHKGGNCNVKQR
ncbi:hypothetical protein FHY55_03315 [Oceanicola sp. D3]|uniref:hypothetical protein n=1 Tax=Oceanicola sp. D3 TaxID=2587163 RepID=UPI001123BB08|nr:hypothetical protein [Oceanicola sp. D3]QDC08330.1 hypothetical protein FHY55_03315 [Oceanicola sp. D3]